MPIGTQIQAWANSLSATFGTTGGEILVIFGGIVAVIAADWAPRLVNGMLVLILLGMILRQFGGTPAAPAKQAQPTS